MTLKRQLTARPPAAPTTNMGIKVNFRTILGTLALVLGAIVAGPALAQTTSTAQPAQDVLGKPDGKLGKVHAAEGYKCAKCHTTAKKTDPVPQETCLACHGDGDSRQLAAITAKVQPVNPHQNRHYGTEADCGLCHKQHQASVNFCADCHPRFDLKVK